MALSSSVERTPAAFRHDPRTTRTAAGWVVRHLRTGGRVLEVDWRTNGLLRAVSGRARESGKRVGERVAVAELVGGPAWGPVRVVRGRGDELPLGDQVFDVVWAGGLLHCTADPVRSARELARVTLPGGTVLVALPSPVSRAWLQRAARQLRWAGPVRRYLDASRGFDAGTFLRTLEEQDCAVESGPRIPSPVNNLLRAAGAPRDLREPPWRLYVVRVPGPRRGGMPVRVEDLDGISEFRVRRLLRDLPVARGYELVVKPLRYRKRPHVQAWCEFEHHRITVQVPVPFRPFVERVPYRARRLPGKGLRFVWSEQRIRFDSPEELIRYLYLHEYYHWYLREVRGKASAAETACDRFALQRM